MATFSCNIKGLEAQGITLGEVAITLEYTVEETLKLMDYYPELVKRMLEVMQQP